MTLTMCGGAPLLALSMIDDMPQRDRPFGWLLDRVLFVGGYSLLGLSALFTMLAMIAWLSARRAAKDGAQTAGG